MEGGGNANSLDRKHTSTASFDQYRRKHAAAMATSSNSGDSSSLIRRGKKNYHKWTRPFLAVLEKT